MAQKDQKYDNNAKGRYYVDRNCIGCDACVLVTADHFEMDYSAPDGLSHAYVKKQPLTDDEEKLCREALEGCPVEAIGSDGVDSE